MHLRTLASKRNLAMRKSVIPTPLTVPINAPSFDQQVLSRKHGKLKNPVHWDSHGSGYIFTSPAVIVLFVLPESPSALCANLSIMESDILKLKLKVDSKNPSESLTPATQVYVHIVALESSNLITTILISPDTAVVCTAPKGASRVGGEQSVTDTIYWELSSPVFWNITETFVLCTNACISELVAILVILPLDALKTNFTSSAFSSNKTCVGESADISVNLQLKRYPSFPTNSPPMGAQNDSCIESPPLILPQRSSSWLPRQSPIRAVHLLP